MDNIFLNSGFEEDATYVNTSGSTAIKAVIFRTTESTINFNTRQGGTEAARKYKIEAYVSRTYVPTVKVNADKIICKRFPGDAATSTFNVVGIITADEGAYRLGLA